MTTESKSLFDKLSAINVNDKVEHKPVGGGKTMTYLSWAWAWSAFKKECPNATYEIVKNPETGLPYFESPQGVMVYTKVTVDGLTHEMWLPVLDGANNVLKSTPYTFKNRNGKEIEVAAFDIFDINRAAMRCLVKNLAMFGLGIYIYAGEDLPMVDDSDVLQEFREASLNGLNALTALHAKYKKASWFNEFWLQNAKALKEAATKSDIGMQA